MPRIIRILFLGMCLISFNSNAGNYLGVNYKYRSMGGRNMDNYAMEPVLNKKYNEGEVYYAHRFTNDVGVSLGYEQSTASSKTYNFYNNQIFLGDTQRVGDTSDFSNKIRAFNFDVTGYYNFTSNFEAVGQLGFALFQAKMKASVFTGGRTVNLNPSDYYQVLPRIGFMLQYFFWRCIGFNAALGWEGTNLYKLNIMDEDGVSQRIRPFRQSWTVSGGLVVRF